MKDPIEYLKDLFDEPFDLSEESIETDFLKVIEQAQKDAYNEALDDACKNAYVEYIDLTTGDIFDYTDVITDDDVGANVNKISILKLKK